MNMTSCGLKRAAGVAAIAAAIGFIIVGIFHPLNIPREAATPTWINVHIVALLMCYFGIFGMTGLYARQSEKSGILGLVGFILLAMWMALVMCLSFVEAYILPIMAIESPRFVEAFLGMFSNQKSAVDLGVLPMLWNISGPMYILGLVLFGIATFRARVFPRYAGLLLVVAGILTPVGGFIPPEYQPLVMVPTGLALAWLGYALARNPSDRVD